MRPFRSWSRNELWNSVHLERLRRTSLKKRHSRGLTRETDHFFGFNSNPWTGSIGVLLFQMNYARSAWKYNRSRRPQSRASRFQVLSSGLTQVNEGFLACKLVPNWTEQWIVHQLATTSHSTAKSVSKSAPSSVFKLATHFFSSLCNNAFFIDFFWTVVPTWIKRCRLFPFFISLSLCEI